MLTTPDINLNPKGLVPVMSGLYFSHLLNNVSRKHDFLRVGPYDFVFFLHVLGLLTLLVFKDQFRQALTMYQCLTQLILKNQDV